MKILAKLLVGFIGVAVLCAIVGIVGITQLANMSANLRSIEVETVPSIVNILGIGESLQQIKGAIRSLATPQSAEDSVFIKRQLDNIETARAEYKKNISVYDPIPRTSEEDKLWKATQAAMAVAASYNNELIALAEKAEKTGIGYDRDKIYEDMYGIISGERRLEFDNALAAITAQSAYVVDYYGVQQIKAATTAATISGTILIIVTIFSFLVAIVLGILLGRSISNPLKKSALILDKMAAGDLSERFVVKSKDEFSLVAASLGKVGDSVGLLIQDAAMLAKAAVDGKLATRADASRHQGDYRKVVDGVNQTLDAVIGPLNVAANYIDRISKGDIPPKISDSYNGDFNEIKNNLNQAIDAVNALVVDAGMLVGAAVDGKLATRADATKHQGDFRKIVDGVNKTLDAVIGPLNVAANYVDRISKGDIPPKITDAYHGDFNEIKNNLNQAIDAVNSLVVDAGMLVGAAVDGKLATRADATKHQGDFRKVVDGVNKTLDAVIGPLNVAANYVDRISKGDIPPKITDAYHGDFNEIKNNLNQAIDAVNALVVDAGMLSAAAVDGKLATRADASKHQGDFRKVVDGVNKTLDSVIGPLNVAANYVDRISKGDIPPKITDTYHGDFNEIKNNLNQAIDAVNALVVDAGMLVGAAVDGKLATRADATKHQGDYRKIVDGVNKTLDAVIGPLNVAADYVDKISAGNIPPRITDTYNGDFNTIKNNLNKAVDAINALVADAGLLVQAAVDGKLATRADATKHQGDYKKIVDGVNKTLDAVIVPLNVAANYVDRISKGDIPPKIIDAYQGDFNEIKNNLNQAIDAVNALVSDAGMLVSAAVDGKLATRADATKHQGDFRKIVDGVNKTLDAVIGPLNVAADYVDKISAGNIPPRITDNYNGDFNTIKNNLNKAVDAVNALVTDAGMLVQAAVEGRLQTRADASKHQGDYRKVVDGVNRTLDLVIAPINETSAVLKRMAEGDLTGRITSDYKGDFDVL
ncbi:MAG: HAMP domain-containing protein, partial [Spirochaetota bacterium]